jgi:hypothetical protein
MNRNYESFLSIKSASAGLSKPALQRIPSQFSKILNTEFHQSGKTSTLFSLTAIWNIWKKLSILRNLF